MYCANCGEPLTARDVYCSKCGAYVYEEYSNLQQPNIPAKKKKTFGTAQIIPVAVIAVVIIAVIAGTVLFLNSDKNNNNTPETIPVSDFLTSDSENEEPIENTEPTRETEHETYSDTTKSTTLPDKDTQGSNYLKLDAGLQYDVNIFLSNFSESSMENFSDRPTDKAMLNFAVSYNLINKHHEFESCEFDAEGEHYGNLRIHKDKVLKTVEKYFGYKLDESACYDTSNYHNGYFYELFTGANPCNGFCVVSSLEKLRNNQYRAVFDIYFDGSDGSNYYGCSTKEINQYSQNDDLYLMKTGTGYAIISASDIYDRSTYKLSMYYDENV